MLHIVFLFIFSYLAFGQPEPELTSTLRPGASVYSKPEFAANPSGTLSTMPWNYWKERCERSSSKPALSGRLLWEQNEVAAIQLDSPGDFCGSYFNHGSPERNLVYVRRTDIASSVPRGEERTEAAVREPACPQCATDPAQAALREMARTAARTPAAKFCRKTDEEMEKYMDCHATENQANYDNHYKKLFDIAGSTFQATYSPGTAGGGVRAILKPEDSQSVNGKIPFWVRTNANVLKCVGLRESRWDPTAVSNTGAKGIGQQTLVNVDHMRCLLEGLCRVPDPKRPGQTTLKQGKPKEWAVQLWKEFFRRVETEFPPAERAKLFKHPTIPGATCTKTMSVRDRDAPCPINSIAAIALYQMEVELAVRRSNTLHNRGNTDFNDEERCHLEVVQGAGNNAGTGTVMRATRGSASPEAWRRGLRAGTGNPDGHGLEADMFSKYIRNCMQSGNMDSMHPRNDGRPASTCSPHSKNQRPAPSAPRGRTR